MIVKVGEQKVDSSEYPVIVEFTDEELKLIRNFDPDQNIIYSYPETSDEKTVEDWVTRRINEESSE